MFADQFDGSGGLDNIVSQARELNQGAWKDMEEKWADARRDGKQVEALIDIDYGDGARPTGFTVHSVVGGMPRTDHFRQ